MIGSLDPIPPPGYPLLVRRRWTGLVLIAGALFATLIAGRADASVVLALDLRELVQGSAQVVVGTVLRQHSLYDSRRRIVTDVTLRVDETLKGAARHGDQIVIRRLGGAIGEIGMRVEGEPAFEVGQRSIVFARRTPSGTLRPVGMAQGVMRIQRLEGRDLVLPNGHGLSLLRRLPDGRLVGAQPAITAPRALDEVLAQIRDVVIESGH